MLHSVIRYIDSLFCETTVVTTRTIITRYTDPVACERVRANCRDLGIEINYLDGKPTTASMQMEAVVVASDEAFVVGDQIIPIPDFIRTMTPIDQVDIGYHCDFPIGETLDILSVGLTAEHPVVTLYGTKPGEILTQSKWDQASIMTQMLDLHQLAWDDASVTGSTRYQNMDIVSLITDEWDYLSVTIQDGTVVQVAIPNPRIHHGYQTYGTHEAILACIHARAILITLIKMGKYIADYNEHDLRSSLIALLMADRSELDDTSITA